MIWDEIYSIMFRRLLSSCKMCDITIQYIKGVTLFAKKLAILLVVVLALSGCSTATKTNIVPSSPSSKIILNNIQLMSQRSVLHRQLQGIQNHQVRLLLLHQQPLPI